MKEIILAIDIGHNVTYDTGAVGIRKEDDLNRLVGNALISKLRGKGIKVVNCTPNTAKSLNDSLYQRVITANNSGAILFVSIHHNACPGGYGAEVLCIKDNYQDGLSTKVGEAILNELASIGLKNRGVKDRRDLYVINNTTMPALLVECAFVDCSSDMANYIQKRPQLQYTKEYVQLLLYQKIKNLVLMMKSIILLNMEIHYGQ